MRREAMDRSGEVMDEKRMRWMDVGGRVGRFDERRRRMEVGDGGSEETRRL